MDQITIPNSFEELDEALNFLNYRLPNMQKKIYAGGRGLQRIKDLLKDIGDPQESYKVIHIAGTSGKGTTCYMIDKLLRDAGVKTGLSVSPYVYDFGERWQVDGRFASDETVLSAINQILPHLKTAHGQNRLPSVFETLMAITFLVMKIEHVEVLVLETGLGGLMDASNTVQKSSKIAVLTNIGLDHTEILGNSLQEIATQKAGIVHAGNEVFAVHQNKDVDVVFEKHSNKVGAKLNWVNSKKFNQKVEPAPYFDLNLSLSLAVANTYLAGTNRHKYNAQDAFNSVVNLNIPGRLEVHELNSGMIIFDGAHNYQKIEGLVRHIQKKWPDTKFNVACIISREQQAEAILECLGEITKKMYFLDYPQLVKSFKSAADQQALEKIAENVGLEYEYLANDYRTLSQIINKTSVDWLITGSFYHLAYIKPLVVI